MNNNPFAIQWNQMQQLGHSYTGTANDYRIQLQNYTYQQMQYATPPVIADPPMPVSKPDKASAVAWLDKRVNEMLMKL